MRPLLLDFIAFLVVHECKFRIRTAWKGEVGSKMKKVEEKAPKMQGASPAPLRFGVLAITDWI